MPLAAWAQSVAYGGIIAFPRHLWWGICCWEAFFPPSCSWTVENVFIMFRKCKGARSQKWSWHHWTRRALFAESFSLESRDNTWPSASLACCHLPIVFSELTNSHALCLQCHVGELSAPSFPYNPSFYPSSSCFLCPFTSDDFRDALIFNPFTPQTPYLEPI